ncbi:MAG: hypothetical protein K9L19_13160 [Desulfarculaceae bacterium]|nr:hypothetical protein [Desulfarculaceae bacterium]MCF8048492.1 hypothetical protein [Desulfarculaceae bacterium]MCF8123560.1 hypothetical protein [Desulfarculaceae bacterium]
MRLQAYEVIRKLAILAWRMALLGLGLALLAYLVMALYALISGERLFFAWPMARFSILRFAPQIEGHLPALLIDWAIIGWLLNLAGSNPARKDLIAGAKSSLSFWYLWAGLPAVVGLFALHTGSIWFAPDSMQGYSIGSSLAGVLPFSDAQGHFQFNQLFAATGEFHFWVMRRPLAAAMRVGLNWLSGFDAFYVLGLQAALLGFSAWLLGLALLRRWGIFSAICAVALVFTYSRNFQATYLVHSLGVSWACLALALLVEFQYRKKLMIFLVGLGAMTIALLVRMGAMFIPPVLILWAAWLFRSNWKKALQVCALSIAVVFVCWASSAYVLHMHGGNSNQQGENFSSVVAGLSINENWSVAIQRYAGQLTGVPKEDASRLYSIAFENIKKHPETLLKALHKRASSFLGESLHILSTGFDAQKSAFLFLLLPILAFIRLCFSSRDVLAFWALLIFATLASAAVVYFAEGTRALAVGYIVLDVFLASALQEGVLKPNPEVSAPIPAHPNSRFTMAVCGILFVYILIAPTLAYHFPPRQAKQWRQAKNTSLAPGEAIVWGGKTMLGLLVVPDGEPLPRQVPAMHVSTFVRSIRKTGYEKIYQRLVTPEPPPVPFAFILSAPHGTNLYVAPEKMLKQKDVILWKIKWEDRYPGPVPAYFKHIVHAEPLRVSK